MATRFMTKGKGAGRKVIPMKDSDATLKLKMPKKVTPADIKSSKDIYVLQDKINSLIFDRQKGAVDPEMLRIVILNEKAYHFRFLKGYTKWKAIGTWETYPDETNTVIEIMYRDTEDERVGIELVKLLEQYNELTSKEDKLFVATYPIEETSLYT
ncbi:hypothetical protein GQ472_01665 [archaeon]|nr:hypothetical protein [archaeon]